MGDTGISGDEDRHTAVRLLGVSPCPPGLPDEILHVVGIHNANVLDTASSDQFLQGEGGTGMSIRCDSRFRCRLHSCHGGNGIVKDDQNKPCAVVNRI